MGTLLSISPFFFPSSSHLSGMSPKEWCPLAHGVPQGSRLLLQVLCLGQPTHLFLILWTFYFFFFLFFFCCAFNIPWSVGFFSFYLFSPWKDFMGSVAVREVVLWRVCDHVYFLRSLWSLQKHPGFHPLFNTASSRSLKLLSKCSGDHMIIFITSHIVISAINLWYKEQSCERGI